MVKLSLTFLSMATAFAVASAAPYFGQRPFDYRECLPGIPFKEFHPFTLANYELGGLLSKHKDSNLLVGGYHEGNKTFQELEFCVVSYNMDQDIPCFPNIPSGCIYQNAEYRFRVHKPVQGYLQIKDEQVRIVLDVKGASKMSMYMETDSALRIAYLNPDGSRSVLEATESGRAVILSEAEEGLESQWFWMMSPLDTNKKVATFSPDQCNNNIPIKEYQPFQLKSYDLETLLSKHMKSNLLVSGFPRGNKYFQEVEFCIVSTENECLTGIPTDCIYPGFEYKFRVNGPVQGYLQIADDQVRIVRDFEEASDFHVYEAEDGGLRIFSLNPDGSRSALETTTPGRAVILTEPELNNGKQWFQVIV